MEARVKKLEHSLQELQEEVRKMRASAPVAAHHAAATPPTIEALQLEPTEEAEETRVDLKALQLEPKEEAEDLEDNGTRGDLKALQLEPREEARDFVDNGSRGDLKVAQTDPMADAWEVYTFQHSIWDASIFIGLPQMGNLGSVMVSILFMLTVAMQLVFCLLINDHLTYAPISEAKVEELRSWRVSHAHNIRYMDTISMKSMARQVCDKENVIWSEGTKALLETIDEYISFGGADPSEVLLGPLLPKTSEVGPMLCVIALLVWYMTLLKDFAAAREVSRALQLVPRARHTRVMVTTCSAGGTQATVECLSHFRLCIALCTVLVRFLVHLLLLWSGSLYLVHTINLSDLILNALALEVVLTLDDLVYEAFVPLDSKKLIGSLRPLPKPPNPSYKGVDFVSAMSFVGAITLAVIMFFVFLLPQVDSMKEARNVMCGNNVDFVAAFANNGLLVVHPSRSGGSPSPVASYEYQSILEAILAEDGLHPTDPAQGRLDFGVYGLGIRGSQRSVEGTRDVGVAESTLLTNTFCIDQAHGSSHSRLEALLRSVFEFDSGVNVTDFCSHETVLSECPRDTPQGVRARQYCSVACGCADSGSSLILTHPGDGCPSTCTIRTPYQTSLLRRTNCTDQDISSEDWEAYGQGLQDLNSSWAGEWQSYLMETHSLVFGYTNRSVTGCQVVPLWKEYLGVDLCHRENAWRWKPLTTLCPEACGCAEEPQQVGCPPACAAG